MMDRIKSEYCICYKYIYIHKVIEREENIYEKYENYGQFRWYCAIDNSKVRPRKIKKKSKKEKSETKNSVLSVVKFSSP